MVRFFSFSFILTLLQQWFMPAGDYQISELNYVSDQVIVDFAKKMEPRGLHVCGIGGREDKGKIIDFKVSFQYSQLLDILKARKLIVELALLFLKEINQNEELRRYLHHYPFNPNDVIVTVLPDSSLLNKNDYDSFVMVKSFLGKVYYYTDDTKIKPFITLHEETFEESRAILGK